MEIKSRRVIVKKLILTRAELITYVMAKVKDTLIAKGDIDFRSLENMIDQINNGNYTSAVAYKPIGSDNGWLTIFEMLCTDYKVTEVEIDPEIEEAKG